jgi:hypothetical protein
MNWTYTPSYRSFLVVILNEEMRGEIFMTRNTLNIKQLIEQNKEELKNDHKALEKIEKKLDSKYLNIKA